MESLLAALTGEFLGTPTYFWVAFVAIVIALLVFDLGILHKDDHEIGAKESLTLYGFYVAIAMAFAGHMMIELIQPKDAEASVYQETIRQRGYGFHHVGIAVEDVEAERAAYAKRGYHVAFSTPVPSGGNVYYMGDGHNAPGFVELIPATTGMDEMFTRYWRASVDWDGRDAVRQFAP